MNKKGSECYMDNLSGNSHKMNQFEWCYLVEDTPSTAREMKIHIPKLQGKNPPSDKANATSVNADSFANSNESKLSSDKKIEQGGPIVAKVQLELAHRHKFHDCEGCPCPNKDHPGDCCHSVTGHLNMCNHYHHDHHFPHNKKGMIPKGTKMICLIMDENTNDVIVTRLWCEFPSGETNGNPPRERYEGD